MKNSIFTKCYLMYNRNTREMMLVEVMNNSDTYYGRLKLRDIISGLSFDFPKDEFEREFTIFYPCVRLLHS